MKLKIIFYLILTCLFFNSGYSQISVGRSNLGLFFKDFRKGEYEVIKKKTTVFVVDDFMLEDFESIVKGTWTVNPYLIMYRDDFEKNKETYIDEQYAIWELKTLFTFYRNTAPPGSSPLICGNAVYLYTDYYYFTDITKDNGVTKFYTDNKIAQVHFGGDREALSEIIMTQTVESPSDDFYNYQLGYMKNYLQVINNYLETKWFSSVYTNTYDKSKIKKLRKATLYVPEFVKLTSNIWHIGEEIENPDQLFKNYKYKYQFIPNDELNEMILNANEKTEDFYYLMHLKLASFRFTSVVNGKTGEILYKSYHIGHEIKTKDIDKLYKKIKK